jgi:LPXTG-motif cell wall-anchored protein
MSKRRSDQGGAILSFIVIAAILVAVTLGAIYFVQQRGITARRDQAIAAANKLAADQKAAQDRADAARKATTAAQVAANQASQTSTTSTTTDQATTAGTTTTATSSSELPTTGPSNSIVTMLAIGMLMGTSVAFVRSRRALSRSL